MGCEKVPAPCRHCWWNEEDEQALQQWVNEARRYSAAQLSHKLAQERLVKLGKEQVRRILKKNYTWKRIHLSPPAQKPTAHYRAKNANWEMLKLWAQLGIVCLKYLDESGCCTQSSTDYGYGQRGEQKQIKPGRRRARDINILGVWQEPEGVTRELQDRADNGLRP